MPIQVLSVCPKFKKIVQRLRKALGDDFLVLGGAVRDQYILGKFKTDVDVFVPADRWSEDVEAAMKKAEFHGGHIVGFGRNNPYMQTAIRWVRGYRADPDMACHGNPAYQKGIVVQVVGCDNTIFALHSFDWTICQFGWSPKLGFFATRQALEALADKKLYLYKCHAFNRTVTRMVKLAKRLSLGLDEASVAVLLDRARKMDDHAELKDKALVHPTLDKKKRKRMSSADLAKTDPVEPAKSLAGVIKFSNGNGLNLHAFLHQVAQHMELPALGPLSLEVVEHDMPNLRWLVEYAEGRMLKPTTDFEGELLARRPLVEVGAPLTDHDLFLDEARQAFVEMRLYRAFCVHSLQLMAETRGIKELDPERTSAERRLAQVEEALRPLPALLACEFELGEVGVVTGEGDGAKMTQVRLGKHLLKLADRIGKLPEKVKVGEYEMKKGERKEAVITLATDTRDVIAGRLKHMLRVFEQRSARQTVPDVDAVTFVVSNAVTDLLTISTSGPWGQRDWSSCQRLGNDMGLYRCVAANTRNTLVAYLVRGTTWIGRQLVRLDPTRRRVLVEPYYGDPNYSRALGECVEAHFGRYKGGSVMAGGFDYMPYSDRHSAFWNASWVPMIDGDRGRHGQSAMEPNDDAVWLDVIGHEPDDDEWLDHEEREEIPF